MPEPYTLMPGYSGPTEVNPLNLEPVIVDVFATSTVTIQAPTPLFAALPGPALFQFTLHANMNRWMPIRNVLAAGIYRWTYVSGALNAHADPAPELSWNAGFAGDTASNRPWLRLGKNDDAVVMFPEPIFKTPGYPSAATAEAAGRYQHVLFKHPGGRLDIRYDADDSIVGAQGAITFEFGAAVNGAGHWSVDWSTAATWPTIKPGSEMAQFPTITGLQPGIHRVRYTHTDMARVQRTHDYWIWVWKAPPRGAKAGYVAFSPLSQDKLRKERYGTGEPLPWEVFPVRPPKVVTPANRNRFIQPLRTSGNQMERPQTGGNLPTEPTQLGWNEQF